MKYYLFCVDDKPFCMWDGEKVSTNREYIKRIQPEYYEFVAEHLIEIINKDDASKQERKFTALSLRNYYTQSLETLFALIFATLQAPACIPGWMLNYRNSDLYNLVKKTNAGQPINTLFTKIHNISWESISKLIFCYFSEEHPEDKEIIIKKFTDLLAAFADDYLDPTLRNEYNSIKHGLRTNAGGFVLKFKEVEKDGSPKNDSEWKDILNSEFGSSFYIRENLKGTKNHFRLKLHSNNYDPENLFHGINFISLVLHNLLTFLKTFNKIKTKNLQYKSVKPEKTFELPWKNISVVGNITMDLGFDYDSVKIFKNEKIKSIYKF